MIFPGEIFNSKAGSVFKVRLIVGGVMMNWVAFAIGVLVTLFLSPFVVHHLGNVGYGVWVLVNSSIAYMGLLDLGLRGAVIRFVARHHTQGNHWEASLTISAALTFRLLLSLAIVALSVALAAGITKFFRIPPNLSSAAQLAVVITGTTFAVTLTCGVFGGVLAALQRFDVTGLVSAIQTLLNAAGVVWLLRSGHGIVGLAVWQLAMAVTANVALTALCFHVYPELRIVFRVPRRSLVQQLWGYSFYLFVIHISAQVIWYTDNLVVGAFLSATAVTFYAIGGRLLDYLREPVAVLAQTFLPVASGFDARGQQGDLRRLLIYGTRCVLLVSLPIDVVLFFRGPTFIRLWMGQQYGHISGEVLRILLLASAVQAANHATGNIIFGLGKHRKVAIWQIAEAIANLSLSVVLVRRIGLYGVAWGTVLPDLVVQLMLWPRYICKLLDVAVSRYFWQAWIRPVLANLPFCIGVISAEHYWKTTSLLHFFLQLGALAPLFALGVVIVFWRELHRQLGSAESELRQQLAARGLFWQSGGRQVPAPALEPRSGV